MQTLNHLRRIQPVTEHIVGLPQINLAVFRRRRAGDFGACGKGFDVAYHGRVVIGNDNDVRLGRYPCLTRHRFETVNGGCGIDTTGAVDDFVGGSILTRYDAPVVAEEVAFAAGRLLFHIRLPLTGQIVLLRALTDMPADVADTLRIGGDAVIMRNIDGFNACFLQVGKNIGRLRHP